MKLLMYTCAILMASCGSSRDISDVPHIKGYDHILENGEKLGLDSFDIIPLETTPRALISTINKLEVVDSLFLIQTDNRLLCFRRDGTFQCQIGERGKGNGEYIRINTFFVDKNKNVNILDEMTSKILTYNVLGKVISVKQFPKGSFSMWKSAIMLDDDLLLHSNYVFNDLNTVYSLFNLKNYEEKVLYKFPGRSENTAEYIGQHTISKHNDTIRLICPFDNVIFNLSRKQMEPCLVVESKKNMVEDEELYKITNFSIMTYSDFMNKGLFDGFTSIYETDKYIFLEVLFNVKYFIIDKTKGLGRCYSYSLNEKGIKNLPLINISATHSNGFIGVVSVNELQCVSEKSHGVGRFFLKKIKNIYREMKKGDNPCLFFYYLK